MGETKVFLQEAVLRQLERLRSWMLWDARRATVRSAMVVDRGDPAGVPSSDLVGGWAFSVTRRT